MSQTYGRENSWSYGTCSGPPSTVKNKVNPCPDLATCPDANTQISRYSNRQALEVECCQSSGSHTLKCSDSYGDGWHGGYIEIRDMSGGTAIATNGITQYCKDFTSGHQKSVLIASSSTSSGISNDHYFHLRNCKTFRILISLT